MTHGRSAVHVANSFGVDVRDLRIITKLIEEEPDLKSFSTFFQAFGMALTADATVAIDGVLDQLNFRNDA
jgi:hypothetical protein